MKTQLTLEQILDLGGFQMLQKVLRFNKIEGDPQVLVESGELKFNKVFAFDSKFKREEIDISKLKMYVATIGDFDEKQKLVAFKYDKKEALTEMSKRTDEKLSLNDLEEIDLENLISLEDGVTVL